MAGGAENRSTVGRVAFVLSGGANLGAVQAGMLHALYERGIVPELIVATSVGAINGAFIASRPQTVETARDLEDIWRRLRRGQIFPFNPLGGLRACVGSRDHLVPGAGLRRLVAEYIEPGAIEGLPIEFHVVAVDVVTGEELLLSRGPTIEAVLASAAIPAILPPVAWEGRALMDGGVANNTPISHAVALGAREIYVLPSGHACALAQPPTTALGMGLHALTLLTQSRLIADIEGHRDQATLVVLPPPCPLAIQPLDFSHADELIRRSLHDAREFLDGGGARRPTIRMHMHRHGPAVPADADRRGPVEPTADPSRSHPPTVSAVGEPLCQRSGPQTSCATVPWSAGIDEHRRDRRRRPRRLDR